MTAENASRRSTRKGRLMLAGLILGLAVTAPARAEDPEVVSVTLASALETAIAHSPRLGSLRASEEAAQADARGAKGARLPAASLNAGYTRLSDVDPFAISLPGGRTIEVFPNIPNAMSSRLSLSYPLFTGGRISGAVRAAEDEVLSSGEDLRAGRADLILETTQAYWGLVTARESAAVLDSALTAYEQHLKDALNRKRAGLAAENEVLAVEVERDRAEVARLQARSADLCAEANLARLLGLPPGTGCHPAEELAGETRAERSAAGSVDSLARAAMENRPEIQALRARFQAARARTGMEKGAYWPQLAAGAGYDYSRPNRRLTPAEDRWKDTWDTSLSLSLTLFDGGRTGAAVGRASAQAAAIERQLEDLEGRTRLEILTRTLDLTTAEKADTVAGRALTSAFQNRKVARDRYREGVGSSSDLLDAEVVLLRAALERTEARARIVLARAALERALGRSS